MVTIFLPLISSMAYYGETRHMEDSSSSSF